MACDVIEREGDTRIDGQPGYEFVITTSHQCVGESGGCRITERILVVGGRRLFMMAVFLPDSPGTSESADAFFASFRLDS